MEGRKLKFSLWRKEIKF